MRLLYFGKDDCAPCRAKWPVVQETAQALAIPLEYLDVADPANEGLVVHHRVRSVPTVVLVGDGARLGAFTGALITPEALTRLVEFQR